MSLGGVRWRRRVMQRPCHLPIRARSVARVGTTRVADWSAPHRPLGLRGGMGHRKAERSPASRRRNRRCRATLPHHDTALPTGYARPRRCPRAATSPSSATARSSALSARVDVSRAKADTSTSTPRSAIAASPRRTASACVSASKRCKERAPFRSIIARGTRRSLGPVSDTLHAACARVNPARLIVAADGRLWSRGVDPDVTVSTWCTHGAAGGVELSVAGDRWQPSEMATMKSAEGRIMKRRLYRAISRRTTGVAVSARSRT